MEHEIADFLTKHQELFWNIGETEPPLPLMDAVASFIDDNPKDFFGCDFSGDRNVFQIFFTGASDYFPARNCKKGEKLDESPVYIFDIADLDERGQVESLHMNFKQ